MAVVERLFCQLRTRFRGRSRRREVAVVERFKQEVMYGLSAGTKKSGRCRGMAVVERWPLVEVRLYGKTSVTTPSGGHPQEKQGIAVSL